VLQARCKTCDRIVHRERGGFNAREVGLCRRGHRMTPENTVDRGDGRRQCLTCRRRSDRRWWRNRTPKQREARREYERITENAKRRARGAYERPTRGVRTEAPRAPGERVVLDAEPFAAWLRSEAPVALEPWARGLGVDGTGLRRHINGQTTEVHIDFVDRVLTAAGVHLSDLYPELYA
jgi:hypothetical protein